MRLIESDNFPFEFVSRLAERESWRKEVHRPIYHLHKWWATRLGSVFRSVLLASVLPDNADLELEFYRHHSLQNLVVFDPFMGSGTTVGEAHKLGITALGRDINPVAAQSVATVLGRMNRQNILAAFTELSEGVSQQISQLYRAIDSRGRSCDALYYFWVMRANCLSCGKVTDLFRSYYVARNANPRRFRDVQILCPCCGEIFPGLRSSEKVKCRKCGFHFDATDGSARGSKAKCTHCQYEFAIVEAMAKSGGRPSYRLYGKLVFAARGVKEYLPATAEDLRQFGACTDLLQQEIAHGEIELPSLALAHGHNTRQAMNYGFSQWRDFFNDRQLLALGWLQRAIGRIDDVDSRRALATLFSGVLEFNNLFASYKGEGTGAVRHMFSHHILKPERMPIEAHVWGTPKSSGAFSTLFRSRLLRLLDYRDAPSELNGRTGPARVCSPPFSGEVDCGWPVQKSYSPRGLYLSCGDSSATGLTSSSIDMVVTDPPFFDNVHYSELADFFQAWQTSNSTETVSTRHAAEVQDKDPARFAEKLRAVFAECRRVLKDDGLLVFSYHHSRADGWSAVAHAIWDAGFRVINSQPVKAEMSVATPKSQAKEPIQLDIILVCRKRFSAVADAPRQSEAIESGNRKVRRLVESGFRLSQNDRKIVLFGQVLVSLTSPDEIERLAERVEAELKHPMEQYAPQIRAEDQLLLFDDAG